MFRRESRRAHLTSEADIFRIGPRMVYLSPEAGMVQEEYLKAQNTRSILREPTLALRHVWFTRNI